MRTFTLPDDIFTGGKTPGPGLLFHNYAAPMGAFRGKSILGKNAISLVISGEKTMRFAERSVEVRDDQIHFLSTGNCLVSMDLKRKTPFRSILIFFDDSHLIQFFIKYKHKISTKSADAAGASDPYISFYKDALIRNFISSLQLLFDTGTEISPEMKQLKFEELLLHLLETHPAPLLSFQVTKSKYPDDLVIRRLVETNITSHIALEELAFLCNTSLSTFKRRFAGIYGTSPNKWFLRRRMELARDLLVLHHERPSDVYAKVGYENHSSFSESFRQIFGTTPKAFQSRQLNVQP